MKSLAWMGMLVFALAACGGSDGAGEGFSGGGLCDDVCSWPRSCFEQFAPSISAEECLDSCDASVDAVGPACLEAIDATVDCLGTCNQDEVSVADIQRCQATAQQIASACD